MALHPGSRHLSSAGKGEGSLRGRPLQGDRAAWSVYSPGLLPLCAGALGVEFLSVSSCGASGVLRCPVFSSERPCLDFALVSHSP